MNIPSPWTEADDLLLRNMWGKGASASEIASRLRGRTKNSVIGRIRRLDLHRSTKGPYVTESRRAAALLRDAPAALGAKPVVRASQTLAFRGPVIVVPVVEAAPPPPAASTHVLTLWADWPRDRCRRPVYQGKVEADTQIFCGGPTGGDVYCPACAKVLRLPPKKKRTAAEAEADYRRMLAMRRAKATKASPK